MLFPIVLVKEIYLELNIATNAITLLDCGLSHAPLLKKQSKYIGASYTLDIK